MAINQKKIYSAFKDLEEMCDLINDLATNLDEEKNNAKFVIQHLAEEMSTKFEKYSELFKELEIEELLAKVDQNNKIKPIKPNNK